MAIAVVAEATGYREYRATGQLSSLDVHVLLDGRRFDLLVDCLEIEVEELVLTELVSQAAAVAQGPCFDIALLVNSLPFDARLVSRPLSNAHICHVRTFLKRHAALQWLAQDVPPLDSTSSRPEE